MVNQVVTITASTQQGPPEIVSAGFVVWLGWSGYDELAGLDLCQDVRGLFFGGAKVVLRLQIDPALRVGVEERGQAQGGVCRDGSLAMHDFIDPARRHADGLGQCVLADAHRHQKLLIQNLARMGPCELGHGVLSVVIDDLYIVCVVGGFIPLEADAPLVIDANAVLPFAVALQCFQAIAGRHAKKVDAVRGVQQSELAQRDCGDIRKPLTFARGGERRRIVALEA